MILNKLCLQYLNKPYTLTWLQLLFFCGATVFVELLLKPKSRRRNLILDRKLSSTFLFPGILWSLPLGFSMKALSYLNPDTLIMFRTATIIGVAVGDYFLFHKKILRFQMFSLCLVFLGAYAYSTYNIVHDIRGIIYGALYSATFVCSQLVLKRAFEQNQTKSIWMRTFYTNLYGSLPILVLGLCNEGIPMHSLIEMNLVGKFFLLSSLLCSVILSYSASMVRDALSATSFDVLGCAGKFLTLLISFQIFSVKVHFGMVAGLYVSLFGSLLYSERVFKLFGRNFGIVIQNICF